MAGRGTPTTWVEPEPWSIWTVYDHPTDYPTFYVARRFEVDADGERPTESVIVSPDLSMIRRAMLLKGLTCLAREAGDDPKIVEIWI